jgi:hypothetical protein
MINGAHGIVVGHGHETQFKNGKYVIVEWQGHGLTRVYVNKWPPFVIADDLRPGTGVGWFSDGWTSHMLLSSAYDVPRRSVDRKFLIEHFGRYSNYVSHVVLAVLQGTCSWAPLIEAMEMSIKSQSEDWKERIELLAWQWDMIAKVVPPHRDPAVLPDEIKNEIVQNEPG